MGILICPIILRHLCQVWTLPVVLRPDKCSPLYCRSPVYRGDPGQAAHSSSSAAAPFGPLPRIPGTQGDHILMAAALIFH